MKLGEGARRSVVVYSVILGILYIIIGSIEFTTGLLDLPNPGTVESILGMPVDLFGGFAALVIGFVYLGATSLWKGRYESLGFVLVGTMLSAVFGVLYLLIVGADGLEAYLACLGGENWTWDWLTSGTAGTGLLRPEIWLFFASLPLLIYTLKITRKGRVQ
jgi:hypothetical protein